MTEYGFTAEDGTKIYAVKWTADQPKAIVQIVHGMAEHITRYDEFARYFNARGFIVAGEDHRGHGKTAGNLENAGYFADRDGWNKVINDNLQLGAKLREEYPGIPFYILGHSMGSFLCRKIIAEFPKGIDKVILSGSGDFKDSEIKMLGTIAKIQKIFLSGRGRAKLIDKLSFSSMNNQFKPGRTGFEWLSRDETKVDEYLADPFCGFIACLGMYEDFASGLAYLQNPEHLKKTPSDLPILFFSGSEDPVGGNTKLIKAVHKKYIESGHAKAELIFNKDGRHESLNETNRKDVYRIFADWLDEA
ncbi:MAG: alpha/beta hydrolase [Spirochaetales bacterium]|nr:alpha/beta hydrolase [Spirochaetales bacterium]